MSYLYRSVNKNDLSELRSIAEEDSRIPMEYDPTFTFAEASIGSRLEYYDQLTSDDFFEVVTIKDSVVAFHIVKKNPYPPNLVIGTIISLWVHPDHRGKGLAANLKVSAEKWARNHGMAFIQTSVHKNNSRMIQVNQANGYEIAYLTFRKQL